MNKNWMRNAANQLWDFTIKCIDTVVLSWKVLRNIQFPAEYFTRNSRYKGLRVVGRIAAFTFLLPWTLTFGVSIIIGLLILLICFISLVVLIGIMESIDNWLEEI